MFLLYLITTVQSAEHNRSHPIISALPFGFGIFHWLWNGCLAGSLFFFPFLSVSLVLYQIDQIKCSWGSLYFFSLKKEADVLELMFYCSWLARLRKPSGVGGEGGCLPRSAGEGGGCMPRSFLLAFEFLSALAVC